MNKQRIHELAVQIVAERKPDPSLVIYEPTIEFLDLEAMLTREERARVVAAGDRTATSYKNLSEKILNEREKQITVEGKGVSATTGFFIAYALAARSSKKVAHGSIMEQVNAGLGERNGDPPIVMEGISILAGLRDVCGLRHAGFEALSSRGAIFPEKYWRIPQPLKDAGIGEDLNAMNQEIDNVYRVLTLRGMEHYLEKLTQKEDEKGWEFRWRVLSHSLDDARQVTNSSWLNHLSAHFNSALALREAIVKLGSSEFPETQQIADRLREFGQQGLPTLMRYTEASEFTIGLLDKRRIILNELGLKPNKDDTRQEKSRLLNVEVTEDTARLFLAAFLANGGSDGMQEVRHQLRKWDDEKVGEAVNAVFKDLTLHDKPPQELEMIRIMAHQQLSVGAIYEAIRHRLATHIVGRFSPHHGFTMPQVYEVLGLDKEYKEAIDISKRQYELVAGLGQRYEDIYGPMFTARGHLVPYTLNISGLDIFHYIKLRGNDSAHPDISGPTKELDAALRKMSPIIFERVIKKD